MSDDLLPGMDDVPPVSAPATPKEEAIAKIKEAMSFTYEGNFFAVRQCCREALAALKEE